MRAVCVSLLALVLLPAASAAGDPSFLFILGDDIGWSDFSYNNGTASTPRIKEWTEAAGTTVFMDFHTGGTVCSPTRYQTVFSPLRN
jgi:arylsulfatase A-like enzyme